MLQQCGFILKGFFNSAAIELQSISNDLSFDFSIPIYGRAENYKFSLFSLTRDGNRSFPPSFCFLDIVKEQ